MKIIDAHMHPFLKDENLTDDEREHFFIRMQKDFTEHKNLCLFLEGA